MSGAEWLRGNGAEVSEQGARVAELVDWAWRGIYHVAPRSLFRADWSKSYVRLAVWDEFSTFDGDLLTRLVVGAHDAGIRVSISACNPTHVEVLFYPRDKRQGTTPQRHPTMEDALASMNRLVPA